MDGLSFARTAVRKWRGWNRMMAKITILDDDNKEVYGPYELQPSRELNDGIITRYIFGFEFDSLNIPFRTCEEGWGKDELFSV